MILSEKSMAIFKKILCIETYDKSLLINLIEILIMNKFVRPRVQIRRET